ncbi:MAG: anti-sigma factor family protein [Terriglobia bacterium]
MNHLEAVNQISEYLERRLEAALRTEFEAHLGSCAECRGMVEDVRQVMEFCQEAEPLVPSPWLVPKIIQATTGHRKPSWAERLLGTIRPLLQPRVAYGVSMAVFSISFILHAANINIRSLKLRDLNPGTWAYRANSKGHLLAARAEKYYYDLRVVYEIQNRLRELRNGQEQQQPKIRKKNSPDGGARGRSRNGFIELAGIPESAPFSPDVSVADVLRAWSQRSLPR